MFLKNINPREMMNSHLTLFLPWFFKWVGEKQPASNENVGDSFESLEDGDMKEWKTNASLLRWHIANIQTQFEMRAGSTRSSFWSSSSSSSSSSSASSFFVVAVVVVAILFLFLPTKVQKDTLTVCRHYVEPIGRYLRVSWVETMDHMEDVVDGDFGIPGCQWQK